MKAQTWANLFICSGCLHDLRDNDFKLSSVESQIKEAFKRQRMTGAGLLQYYIDGEGMSAFNTFSLIIVSVHLFAWFYLMCIFSIR